MAAFTTNATPAYLDPVAGRRKCRYRNKFDIGDNRLSVRQMRLNELASLSCLEVSLDAD